MASRGWGTTHPVPMPILIECPANAHFGAGPLMLTFEGSDQICINSEHLKIFQEVRMYYGSATDGRRFRIHESRP